MKNGEPTGSSPSDRGGIDANPLLLPFKVLNAARQAVPAVDYALGVAGISAATAIVVFFIGRTQASIIIVALVFIGMVLLFTFSRLAVAQDPPIRLAGVVLLWGVLGFFLVFLGFTVTAFLWRAPSAWADFLAIPHNDDNYRADNVIGRELAGRAVLDILVDAGVIWALTAKTATGPVIQNPYGSQYPTKDVRLFKIESSTEVSSVQVAQLPLAEGLVYADGGHITVFLVYRVGDGRDYANAGTVYTFHKSPFYDLGSETVFDGRNWGGFPMFADGHLKYFSYEQNPNHDYYWVIDNKEDGVATKQDAMLEWRIQEAKKSAGLMPSNYAGPHQVIDELIDYSNRYQARSAGRRGTN